MDFIKFVEKAKKDKNISKEKLKKCLDSLIFAKKLQQETQQYKEQIQQLDIQIQQKINTINESHQLLLNTQQQINNLEKNIIMDQSFSSDQILDYSLFIDQNTPFPQQLSNSILIHQYKNYIGRCLPPILEIVSMTNTQVKLSLKSEDQSFISYTIDGSYPTAFLGTTNQGFQDDLIMISIEKTSTIKAICFKQNYQESILVEQYIELIDRQLYQHGAQRPEEIFDMFFQLPSGTPYDINSSNTPLYSNFNTPR